MGKLLSFISRRQPHGHARVYTTGDGVRRDSRDLLNAFAQAQKPKEAVQATIHPKVLV